MSFGLWEHDALIAGQFAARRGRQYHSPEKRLLIAVLLGAVEEYQELIHSVESPDDARLQRLEAWFRMSDDKWPFSFANLCHQLDLDPDYIWRRVSQMAQEER